MYSTVHNYNEAGGSSQRLTFLFKIAKPLQCFFILKVAWFVTLVVVCYKVCSWPSSAEQRRIHQGKGVKREKKRKASVQL